MELEEGTNVLCTVDKIIGTTVFVRIENNGEGTIITSEIAPGRIRNLRDYVVPKKKIVCKILRISGDRIDLSLRRVTPKERKEVLEEYSEEKSYESIIKKFLEAKSEEVLNKIKQKGRVYDFIEEAKEDPKEFEALAGKELAKKILDILKTEKKKLVIVKKEICLKTTSPEGLKEIKKIFEDIKDAEINYICAGKYSLKIESSDAKKADTRLREIISEIEKKTKKHEFEFSTL